MFSSGFNVIGQPHKFCGSQYTYLIKQYDVQHSYIKNLTLLVVSIIASLWLFSLHSVCSVGVHREGKGGGYVFSRKKIYIPKNVPNYFTLFLKQVRP